MVLGVFKDHPPPIREFMLLKSFSPQSYEGEPPLIFLPIPRHFTVTVKARLGLVVPAVLAS